MAVTQAIKRTRAAARRLEQHCAKTDSRAWVVNRRERTRQLIELGGLVVKSGLVELTNDDRAVIYGGLLAIADNLSGDDREGVLQRLESRGHRAFEAEAGGKKRVPKRVDSAFDSELANPVR
jgi:hypothetical protein